MLTNLHFRPVEHDHVVLAPVTRFPACRASYSLARSLVAARDKMMVYCGEVSAQSHCQTHVQFHSLDHGHTSHVLESPYCLDDGLTLFCFCSVAAVDFFAVSYSKSVIRSPSHHGHGLSPTPSSSIGLRAWPVQQRSLAEPRIVAYAGELPPQCHTKVAMISIQNQIEVQPFSRRSGPCRAEGLVPSLLQARKPYLTPIHASQYSCVAGWGS